MFISSERNLNYTLEMFDKYLVALGLVVALIMQLTWDFINTDVKYNSLLITGILEFFICLITLFLICIFYILRAGRKDEEAYDVAKATFSLFGAIIFCSLLFPIPNIEKLLSSSFPFLDFFILLYLPLIFVFEIILVLKFPEYARKLVEFSEKDTEEVNDLQERSEGEEEE